MLRGLGGLLGTAFVVALVGCGNESTGNTQGTNGGAGSNGTGGSANPGVGGTSQNGTSGDGSTGGMNVGSDSGSSGGGIVGSNDAAVGSDAARPSGGCSEMPIRTGPLPGKESFTVLTPADTHFPFTKHWVGVFNDDPRFIGMTSLTDLDNDGDLDFATGQREDLGGGMYWYEYCAPDHWVRHYVGTGHKSAAGGGAMDVDGDGWVDLVASDSWYKNPKNPRTSGDWQRYVIKTDLRVEEVVIGDVNNDKKPDALFLMTGIEPQWWTPGPDATQQWTIGKLIGTTAGQMQRQGGSIGDIDGDGKNDVLAGRMWWYRNVNGDGMTWEAHQFAQPADFTDEPLTYLGDLDGDGDTDFAMVTHWGGDTGAEVAWWENVDGKGLNMVKHQLATGLGWLHDVVIADFDNDGDNDILVAKNVGPIWIWENTDGKGHFVQHTISNDFRGHDARVADVDCDGDLDIVGNPWGDPNEGGEGSNPPRDIVYLQNMLVEQGGKPVWDRPHEMTFFKQPPYTCKR